MKKEKEKKVKMIGQDQYSLVIVIHVHYKNVVR